MNELKPCPFCGRIPTVDDCGDNRFFVRCKCGIVQDKLYGQRCDAVRRWNTRRQQPDVLDINVGDTISRQALMKEFSDFVRRSNNSDFAPTPTWNDAVSLVGSMPSAQRKGRWKDYPIADGCIQCSVCGVLRMGEPSNFCPNCGARMEVEK